MQKFSYLILHGLVTCVQVFVSDPISISEIFGKWLPIKLEAGIRMKWKLVSDKSESQYPNEM